MLLVASCCENDFYTVSTNWPTPSLSHQLPIPVEAVTLRTMDIVQVDFFRKANNWHILKDISLDAGFADKLNLREYKVDEDFNCRLNGVNVW